MPTALYFIPCQRPLMDVLTESMTLVSVLDNAQSVPFPHTENEPPELQEARFLLPPFFLVVSWLREEGDEGEWEQHVTFTAPDGKEVVLTPNQPFQLGTSRHRVLQQTNFISGRLFGVSMLSLKLRRAGSEDWETVKQYPLLIEEFPTAPPSTEDNPQITDEA